MTDDMNAGAQALASALSKARCIVGFTGAGISTESGVPDFRSPGSPWLQYPPMPFQDFLKSEANRLEAWRRKFIMDDLYRDARPGRGHRAFATLTQSGRMPLLVTQNIDRLHQKAGFPEERVVELHGNGSHACCLSCGQRHDIAPIRASIEAVGTPPACGGCGGILKSATISFGQAIPEWAIERARQACGACDLFLAVGSSLVVQPAAVFPMLAKRAGAILVIVNREPTPLDGIADLLVRADIGTVLEEAVTTGIS